MIPLPSPTLEAPTTVDANQALSDTHFKEFIQEDAFKTCIHEVNNHLGNIYALTDTQIENSSENNALIRKNAHSASEHLKSLHRLFFSPLRTSPEYFNPCQSFTRYNFLWKAILKRPLNLTIDPQTHPSDCLFYAHEMNLLRTIAITLFMLNPQFSKSVPASLTLNMQETLLTLSLTFDSTTPPSFESMSFSEQALINNSITLSQEQTSTSYTYLFSITPETEAA